MLHKRYPKASARAMEVVRRAMTDDMPLEGVPAAKRAFVLAENTLESEGY